MMALEGKTAIVTGGAAGIGRAIVEAFAQAGARVAFCDIDAARGTSTADAIAREGAEVMFRPADVADRMTVASLVDAAAQRYGRVDVLVNNAGITHDRILFGALDFATWRRVFDVNLDGLFFTIEAVLPHMRRARSGSIVNVGSILASAGFAGKTAYCASKAAVAGFTKALALDLAADRIRVNCLIPGSVDTDMMWRGLDAGARVEAEAVCAADVPLGRVGAPRELAAAALFLASDAASYVTGTELLVDGGLLARIAASR